MASERSIAASASYCPRICCGWRTPKRKNGFGSSPADCAEKDVKVGAHIAVSPGAVPRFLKRFEEVYSYLGKTDSILGAAAAHHRLVWIHPFVDGNGRVSRLMSHAMLLDDTRYRRRLVGGARPGTQCG